MNDVLQTDIVLFVMRSLKKHGSWCGETHVQKSLYLCQEVAHVAANFKYVLYKHGPYSFELSECLQCLIADDFVHVRSRPPYGPSLELSYEADLFAENVTGVPDLASRICFILNKVNKRGVSDLERLATAVYINNKYSKDLSLENKAEILNSIKSHVSVNAAKSAFAEIESIAQEVKSSFA